jgi:GNAT superfamily N-acetyltransferase
MSLTHIRPATLEDMPTLLSFELGIINTERPFDPTLKPDPIHYYDLESLIKSHDAIVLIAELDGQLIGSGYADIRISKPYYQHERYAYLGFMYVSPEYRGMQIIHMILDALKEWCKTKQVFELRLEVYAQNLPAIKAYIKAGFSYNLIEMGMRI